MRIGILGGTFDPIHNGHLEMAGRVHRLFRCTQLLLMPAYSPPHKAKSSITSSYHRYAMTVLATSGMPDLYISRLELELPSKPFTVQTIAQLKASFAQESELLFIMGADSFQDLDSWRDYQQLLQSCYIVVVTRPGYQFDLAERQAALQREILDLRGRREPIGALTGLANILLTDLIDLDISATEIRSAVAEGKPIDQWVPTAVAQYIAKYQLYQEKHERNNQCSK